MHRKAILAACQQIYKYTVVWGALQVWPVSRMCGRTAITHSWLSSQVFFTTSSFRIWHRNIYEKIVPHQPCKQAEKHTDLQELGSRGVVREQIQSLLDDVAAGPASLVVFRLLPFTEDLDGGESTDLRQKVHSDDLSPQVKYSLFHKTKA